MNLKQALTNFITWLAGFKQFFDVFVVMLKTSAGYAFILTLCLVFQIPGMTMFVSKLMIARSGEMPLLVAYLIGVAIALVIDIVIFFFAINGWRWLAIMSAFFSSVLSTLSWGAVFLSAATGLAYWLEITPAIMLGVVPGAVIGIVSHKLDNKIKYDTGIDGLVNTIQRDAEINLRAAVNNAIERLNRQEPEKLDGGGLSLEELLNAK